MSRFEYDDGLEARLPAALILEEEAAYYHDFLEAEPRIRARMTELIEELGLPLPSLLSREAPAEVSGLTTQDAQIIPFPNRVASEEEIR